MRVRTSIVILLATIVMLSGTAVVLWSARPQGATDIEAAAGENRARYLAEAGLAVARYAMSTADGSLPPEVISIGGDTVEVTAEPAAGGLVWIVARPRGPASPRLRALVRPRGEPIPFVPEEWTE